MSDTIQKVKLGDICEKFSSNIAQKDLKNNFGKYPIYGAAGLIKNVEFYQQEREYLAIVKDGAGVGRVMKLPANSSIISTMQGIIPNYNVEINYLYYLLTYLDLAKFWSGSTIPHIYFKDYKNEEIKLPQLNEQKAIAEKLDKVTDLIEKRKKQIEKLDELIKSRFIEMFGEIRQELALNKLCNFIDYRGKTPEKSKEGLPFITARNVKMHYMSFETLEFISESTYKDVMTRGIPKEGDVLFTTEAPLGNVCRVPHFDTKFYIGQRIITMQPILVKAAYLEYALSSNEFKNKLAEKASGSTVTGIRSKLLEKLTIPVPPIELQNKFAEFVEKVEKNKSAIKKSLSSLETLKKSLMQKYFG